MQEKDIIEILTSSEAILKGHFKLSSGFHSDTYVQCAKLLMNANASEIICKELAKKIEAKFGPNAFDIVLSPAMGGILVGYELSRHLKLPNIFCERVNGVFELRRGFHLEKNQRALVVEDVVTTGKSSIETFELAEKLGANVVAEASIINRSGKELVGEKPLVSLVNLDIPVYEENNLPEHLKNIPVTKPGSRFLQTT